MKMMVWSRFLIYSLVVLVPAQPVSSGLQVSNQSRPHGATSEKALSFLASLDSLPIEFRADIQLGAVESGNVPAGKLQENMLQRLFESAETAQYASQQQLIPTQTHNLEDATIMSLRTYRLDKLSIQTRIVRAMTRIDPGVAARELQAIRLQFPRTDCSSPMVPDPTDYYSEIGTIANGVFLAQHLGRATYLGWLDEQIASMNSPVQIAAIAALLAASSLNAEEFQRQSYNFAQTLGQLRATDREMAALNQERVLSASIRRMAAQEMRSGIWVGQLVQNYRLFLVRSAAAVPCADITSDWHQIVEDFNRLRSEALAADIVAPLDERLLNRLPTAGERAQMQEIPDEPKFDELLIKPERLRMDQGASMSVGDLGTEGWEVDVTELLNLLDDLDPSTAKCPDCVYYEKARYYLFLFDALPSGHYKEQCLSRVIATLATSPLQSSARVAWMFDLKLLLNTTRTLTKEQAQQVEIITRAGRNGTMLPSTMGPVIRSEMLQSGNNVIYSYVVAEAYFPSPFSAPYLH